MKNRRVFLKQISLATMGIGLTNAATAGLFPAKRKIAANDKVNIGLIGCKGQGWNNLKAFLKIPESRISAICDIDQTVINQRLNDLKDLSNDKPVIYKDYRKLLADKNVDVVIIATPDHWHCLQMTDACAAGKHIFCEKPAANSIYEAELMVKAANRYNSIVQVAQWQRSQQHFKDAIAYVHSGKLGKVSSTKAWMYRGGTTPLPVIPNSSVPDGVDYAMWLGPATQRPFNKNRFHYEFRWFWDYAGGLMTDWGVHLIDMVLLGMNAHHPTSVMATGGKYAFPDDARETPDVQTALYDFGHFQMTWEHNMATGVGLYNMQHGIAFIGENGTLLLNRGGWEVRPEKDKIEKVEWQKSVDNGLDLHAVNFMEALKANNKKQLNCPIEAGANVAVNAHMGNIAVRTGEKIYWDDSKQAFNNQTANKLVTPVYQNGWKLPHF